MDRPASGARKKDMSHVIRLWFGPNLPGAETPGAKRRDVDEATQPEEAFIRSQDDP